MDKQVSGTNPLRGAEVRKIPQGEELQALQAARKDDKQNVFFKDLKGDTYEAAGKGMDLKGVAPGATIQFANQEVTVTAVDAGLPAADQLTEAQYRKLLSLKQEAESTGTSAAYGTYAAALSPVSRELAELALQNAVRQICNPDDGLLVATLAMKLSLFAAVGPALARGMAQAADDDLLQRFALEAGKLGYDVQADFAMQGAVRLQKVAP